MKRTNVEIQPFTCALQRDMPTWPPFFIKFGAITNIQNKQGETPLHLAAQHGHVRLVEILMKAGSSPYIVSDRGTPKDVAAANPVLISLLESPIIPALPTSPRGALVKSTKQRGRALSSQSICKPKEVIPAVASHRLILRSIEIRSQSEDEETSVYTKHLTLTITDELCRELTPALFNTQWLEATVKFIMSQPVFKWDNSSILNNKIEVMKWLCEFIEDEEKHQTYLRFLKKNYSSYIAIAKVDSEKSPRKPPKTSSSRSGDTSDDSDLELRLVQSSSSKDRISRSRGREERSADLSESNSSELLKKVRERSEVSPSKRRDSADVTESGSSDAVLKKVRERVDGSPKKKESTSMKRSHSRPMSCSSGSVPIIKTTPPSSPVRASSTIVITAPPSPSVVFSKRSGRSSKESSHDDDDVILEEGSTMVSSKRASSVKTIPIHSHSHAHKKPLRKQPSGPRPVSMQYSSASSGSFATTASKAKKALLFDNEPKRLTASNPTSPSKKQKKLVLEDRKLPQYPWEISMGDLEFHEKIGLGGFGLVHRGTWKDKEVAIKKIGIDALEKDSIIAFLQEIAILSCLHHKNVLRFIGACLGHPICLITEYCVNGDLSEYMKTKTLEWPKMLNFSLQIAKGMDYLHSLPQPVVHRDLKGTNILVDEKEVLKLSDFGLGKHISLDSATDGGIGTICWCAPEVLILDEPFTAKADVYSFGMTLYEIVSKGDTPYSDLDELETLRSIQEGIKPKLPEGLDSDFKSMVENCWKERDERPNFHEIMIALKKIKKKQRKHLEVQRTSSKRSRSRDAR
eukprot:TRINITY_DN7043_c0_g1_i1.p1 TRINITY_DN7043_c0_g1~~TRINITY_DN7043_c0_g1_i1.p1  ORF type:complete len:801 (+),score=133.62 TRINITY_DN7043_c0_g1_i1:480-2882(+)